MYIPVRPDPVLPTDTTVKVLTPAITNDMNRQVSEGKAPPYVYFSFSDGDYLRFAVWQQQILSYIKQQNALLDYYEKNAKQRNEKIEKELTDGSN